MKLQLKQMVFIGISLLTEYLITEERWRQTREAKRKKQELAAQTGKHKQNAPEPAQNLVSAKQKELEKKLKSIAGFHMAKNIKRFVIICKDRC